MTTVPHRRFNALSGEWILVSPQRTQRPWQGKRESAAFDQRPAHDPNCYLCPGNVRANGGKNPLYQYTYVFDNDFAALLPVSQITPEEFNPLFRRDHVTGTCRVICFSPRHDLTLPEMSIPDIRRVIDVWAEQVQELGQKYRWIQVFENKGEIMGCSNPHPHGQIWALSVLPNEPFKENRRQAEYFAANDRALLCDYLAQETKREERLILENNHWVTLIPFWAVWPFEAILIPKRHVWRLSDLSIEERDALADILKRQLTRYDNLFETSFPYSMGWHAAPNDENDYSYWQLHAHFYPPLLRSASIKKFMVGYEMLAEAQRDITPEQAAEKMRKLSDIHFRERHFYD